MVTNEKQSEQIISNHIYRIEAEHLRRKSIIVNIILVAIAIPILIVLYFFNIGLLTIGVYFMVFLFVIIINFLFYYYRLLLPDIRLSMYITTMGLYLLTISMIIDLRIPSVFTMLFLSYAIISLYQDLKLSIFNSVLLLISGIFIITQFTGIFDLQTLTPSTFYIMFFLIIFVALLSVSSFIIIKRKNHFYRQVVDIKEKEYKYIETIFDLQQIFTQRKFDYDEYYSKINDFCDELSKEIGIDNVFKERINILKELANLKDSSILRKYEDYNQADLDELKQLELSKYKKISYLAFKSAQIKEINTSVQEMLLDKNKSSFNDRNDDYEVKIVVFSVLYLMLRLGNNYFPPLNNAQVETLLTSQNFASYFPEEFLNFIINNKNKLDKQIKAYQKEEAETS